MTSSFAMNSFKHPSNRINYESIMTAVTRLPTGENIETSCSSCYKILDIASSATFIPLLCHYSDGHSNSFETNITNKIIS